MTDTIDAYYWMQSDWAYFGNPRLKELGKRYGLKVNHKPIDLATVYSRTGGIKLEYRSVERKNYRLLEMKRFREILGMPINLEPKFWPKTGHLPSWFVIAADALGAETYDVSQAIMTALWVDDVDVEDPGELVRIANGLGLLGEKILAEAKDPRSELAYIRNTNEAIARGVFGAPLYFIRGEAFWGQERLDMLVQTIKRTL